MQSVSTSTSGHNDGNRSGAVHGGGKGGPRDQGGADRTCQCGRNHYPRPCTARQCYLCQMMHQPRARCRGPIGDLQIRVESLEERNAALSKDNDSLQQQNEMLTAELTRTKNAFAAFLPLPRAFQLSPDMIMGGRLDFGVDIGLSSAQIAQSPVPTRAPVGSLQNAIRISRGGGHVGIGGRGRRLGGESGAQSRQVLTASAERSGAARGLLKPIDRRVITKQQTKNKRDKERYKKNQQRKNQDNGKGYEKKMGLEDMDMEDGELPSGPATITTAPPLPTPSQQQQQQQQKQQGQEQSLVLRQTRLNWSEEA